MAVQQLGLAAGAAAANLLGGLLVDRLGWRGVFGVMGVPGFVLAGLLLLTLEDPPTAGLGKYGDARGVGASGDGASGDESEAAPGAGARRRRRDARDVVVVAGGGGGELIRREFLVAP